MSSIADRSPAQISPKTAKALPSTPFLGLIDAVLVEEPVTYVFDGSIERAQAQAAWIWVTRDLCADILPREAIEAGTVSSAELEALMPEVLVRMREGLRQADDFEAGRRLRAQLGSEEARERLPFVINALRGRALLTKAQAFGKAVNAITDDAALVVAIQSMPLHDAPAASLLFHAALGQIANPTRLVTTALKLAGGGSEAIIERAGFAPLVDAVLAHAQNQLHPLQTVGAFADIDLTCQALDRFHKLIRSLAGYVQFARGSRWSTVLMGVTKQVSDRIEPRLREIVPDVNQALRQGREGADRLDHDRLLAAINGMYLLTTVRECRDSMALNAAFDQAWSQSGQALEVHLARNLELLRENADNKLVGARMDAGIKMAEIRFNTEYGDTLRRARSAAERRS